MVGEQLPNTRRPIRPTTRPDSPNPSAQTADGQGVDLQEKAVGMTVSAT
jgi:hypothetical protein